MEVCDFQSMSVDELWVIHQELTRKLAQMIEAEKIKLEQRLRMIEDTSDAWKSDRERRPYPAVLPKYQNPSNPTEVWSGRGRQPRWIAARLQAGAHLEEFLIAEAPGTRPTQD